MEHSYFLAQLFGLSFVLFAVIGLIRPTLVKSAVEDFNRSPFVTVVLGYTIMVIGLAIILAHNIWDGSWRVIITLLGWGALIKGLTYMLYPGTLMNVSSPLFSSQNRIRGVLALLLVLGICLAVKGFDM